MSDEWMTDGEAETKVHPFDGERAERVVPADGDPAAEEWYAAHPPSGSSNGSPYRVVWMNQRVMAPRHGVRWGAVVVLLAILALLLVKPLVALAAFGVVLIGSIVVVGIVATGTLLLAARMVLGARHR
jgi:hypothetical protein